MPDFERIARALSETWPARLAQGAYNGFMAPGRALASEEPITTEQMIAPAMDMSSLMMMGSGAVPGGANELRAGIRPYQNVPESLMGFRKNGPQRAFDDAAYPVSQDVSVTFPATGSVPRETIIDQVKGMNPDHALERAYRNWPDAMHIRAGK